MSECNKCGSEKTRQKYIPEGKLITASSLKKIDNEFIRSSEYDYYFSLISKKEHLFFNCIDCGYETRINTNR